MHIHIEEVPELPYSECIYAVFKLPVYLLIIS